MIHNKTISFKGEERRKKKENCDGTTDISRNREIMHLINDREETDTNRGREGEREDKKKGSIK